MEIRRITPEEFGGKEFRYRYETDGYYDIQKTDSGFCVEKKTLAEPETVDDPAYMLEDWMEDPVAFGAFENGELIGFTDGYFEAWNGRFWITNLHVFESVSRGRGIGSALLQKMLDSAAQTNARAVMVETQNGNVRALNFYRKHGFAWIGFDLYFYSDTDPEKRNIRVLLSKEL